MELLILCYICVPPHRYPYDNPTADNLPTMEDGLLFFEIANAYASANPTLAAGTKCNGWKFGAGVVVGSDLQTTRNTLQDYLYSQKNEFMVRESEFLTIFEKLWVLYFLFLFYIYIHSETSTVLFISKLKTHLFTRQVMKSDFIFCSVVPCSVVKCSVV